MIFLTKFAIYRYLSVILIMTVTRSYLHLYRNKPLNTTIIHIREKLQSSVYLSALVCGTILTTSCADMDFFDSGVTKGWDEYILKAS